MEGRGYNEDDALRVARAFAHRGFTATWLRKQDRPTACPFWTAVAAEIDALEAAVEARHRWRVIEGGETGRPNPLTRRFAIADKRAESPFTLVPVPAGQQRRYRR
jgi:hypothetical protein